MYVVLAVGSLLALVSLFFGAPFVPSQVKDLSRVLRKAGAKKGDTFYDLGFGSGTVLVKAAQAGLAVRGFEINPLLWCVAKVRLHSYDHRLYLRPWQGAALAEADFVFIFTTTHHAKSSYFERIPDSTTVISFGTTLKRLQKRRATHTVGAYTVYDPVVPTDKKR